MKIIVTPEGRLDIVESSDTSPADTEVVRPDRAQRAELRRLADRLDDARPDAALFARRMAGTEWAVPPVC